MSLVGPRPHANAHNEQYRSLIRGYMLRHKVKPGITGLAQVNGWRGETDTLEKMEQRVEHDLEPDQWAALVDAWGGCAYCGAEGVALQKDCVLALSRGGRYTLDNVVPACRSCNASKCNDEVTAWMRRKRLDERQFLLRHHQIQQTFADA